MELKYYEKEGLAILRALGNTQFDKSKFKRVNSNFWAAIAYGDIDEVADAFRELVDYDKEVTANEKLS